MKKSIYYFLFVAALLFSFNAQAQETATGTAPASDGSFIDFAKLSSTNTELRFTTFK